MKKYMYFCIPAPVFFTMDSVTGMFGSYLVRGVLFLPALALVAMAIKMRNNRKSLIITIVFTIIYIVCYYLFYQAIQPIGDPLSGC